MQGAIGNQAMLRLLPRRSSEVPASSAERMSRDFPRVLMSPLERCEASGQGPTVAVPVQTLIQPKLAIGAIDDPLEREADRVADRVMRMPASSQSVASAPGQISRESAARKEQDIATRQMKRAGSAESPAVEAPPAVHEMLSSAGRPLDEPTRGYFEPRFNQDFSQVRVHTDERAAASAQALGALAYTVGPHIAFGGSNFAPSSDDGRRLIAHELTHVVQQGAAIAAERQDANGASAENRAEPRFFRQAGQSADNRDLSPIPAMHAIHQSAGGSATGARLVQRRPFAPSTARATVVEESKTTNEVKESVKTYCYEILHNADLDPDTWYSNFTTASFLGISVPDIHNELAAHLRERETFFLGKYGDAETARKSLGLIDMSWPGGRPYPTSAAISMHLFGLAVDVNYDENPLIKPSANEVFKRAGVMSDGRAREYHGGMSFEQLEALNDVLVDYFHYLDWNDIPGRLAELGNNAPAAFKGKSEAQVKVLIQRDIDDLGVKWERTGSKNKIRDFGFMRLTKEFKEGIGLFWGGSYGDIMHFDMRNAHGPGQHGAVIHGAIGAYIAKKTAEAKKVDADDGHGGKTQ